MCTMRNFPNLIDHCIEWGRDHFNTMFTDRTQDALNFMENPIDFLNRIKQITTSAGVKNQLEEIAKVLKLKLSADFS